ncbi:MAG: MFS transporter [Alphaproteobacteria bacterium]|nr:MFS transporter [Alphaproteobacteria bacterium]
MNPTPESLSRAQSLSILGGAALMLSLAMGMRQSLGLFQPHVVRDFGLTVADYSFALAMQNIVWGATQAPIGAIADKFGGRWVAVAGALAYVGGLMLTLWGGDALTLTLGAGVLIGIALSCCASNMAMSVTQRTVTAARRSLAMGAVSALGSLGLTAASPLAQFLITGQGWQVAMLAFIALSAAMLPAAWMSGGADRLSVAGARGKDQSLSEVVGEATRHPGYVVMTIAFFVCGLQLVFLTTHLPIYLDICGIDPAVGAGALALIGLFNVGGSYLFGWLGGRYSKRALLGIIYLLRSAIITVYFITPPTAASTLIFGAAMGTLWLGVIPLVNGLVTHLFGLRFVATLTGLAFFSHQLGSFLGAWGGGFVFDLFGSYDYAWQAAVGIGLLAGLFQMTMNLTPSPRLAAQPA